MEMVPTSEAHTQTQGSRPTKVQRADSHLWAEAQGGEPEVPVVDVLRTRRIESPDVRHQVAAHCKPGSGRVRRKPQTARVWFREEPERVWSRADALLVGIHQASLVDVWGPVAWDVDWLDAAKLTWRKASDRAFVSG